MDDDLGTRETFDCALRPAGFTVGTAGSGAEALAIARSRRFDLMLIDLRLPDMVGTDVARALLNEAAPAPFVLMSAFLTTEVTVKAMRLGAIDVLNKPIDVDDLLAIVRSAILPPRITTNDSKQATVALVGGVRAPGPAIGRPRSPAERWARHVLKASEAEEDLRTLADWATYAGLSYSTLCESCRLVGVRPHDARDLARMLRAIIKSSRERCHLEMLLDISERRTLKHLLDRAGLDAGSSAGSVSVERFLECQQFVPRDNDGLRVLRRLLVDRFGWS